MLREHDRHVPVDTSNDTATTNDWKEFLERVDAHDRSLFTEGIELTHTKLPQEKPPGIAGQLYEARQGTDMSPVVDTLWSYGGVAPMSLVSNENGLLPTEVSAVIGHGITGILEIKPAGEVEELLQNSHEGTNKNVTAIVSAVNEGHLEPTQPILFSRQITHLYNEIAAD
jgi:hypothetical protein